MILHRDNSTIRLIRQWDHSRLAGWFLRHWGNPPFEKTARWNSLCRATAVHDSGWDRPDSQPLYDASRRAPTNFFRFPWSKHASFYGRALDRVEDDPYACLLVSLHWTGLYTRFWGLRPEADFIPTEEKDLLTRVVREQERQWIEWKREIWNPGMGPRREFEGQVWNHYDLLEWADQLSLVACGFLLDPGEEMDLFPVPDASGTHRQVRCFYDAWGRVRLDPYPFKEQPVRYALPYVEIPDRPYRTKEELGVTYSTAKEQTLIVRVQQTEG